MNFTFGALNTIEQGSWRRFTYADLTILLCRAYGEWRYLSWTGEGPIELPGDEGKNDVLPRDLDFIRWDCGEDDSAVVLQPVYPDLPVIAKPRGHISIPAGGSAEYILGIPVFIEIKADCEAVPTSFGAIPTMALTKTWHGNQHVGTACYALRTHARRSVDEAESDAYAHEIICQLQVRNQDDDATSFERLYLELDHHAIFEKDSQLWGTACRIRIAESGEDFSHISYTDSPLAPAEDAKQLVAPKFGSTRKSVLRHPFSSFFDVLSR